MLSGPLLRSSRKLGIAVAIVLGGCAETQPVAAEADEIEEAVNRADNQASAVRSEPTRSQRN